MRVLIVTQYFWPESFRVNDLALALSDRGHDVVVLTGMPNYPAGRLYEGYSLFEPARESFRGVAVRRVPLVPRGSSRWRLALNYLWFAASATLLGPLRVPEPCDVIFVFEVSPVTVGLPAAALRRLKHAPMLFWVQDLWPESLAATGMARSAVLSRVVTALVRFIYRRSDRVLVQSEGFVPRVCGVGAEPRRVVYFPNWAESLYRPLQLEADAPERGEVPPGFIVMYAGNLGAAQSLETVLHAAERLRTRPEIQWVVLGDGHRREWLLDEIERRGLAATVRYLGSRPVTAMPRYFAIADALLVTLRRDPVFALTVPTRLQSYFACARPVAGALDGEGARIIRDSGAGTAVAAEDAAGLAGSVAALASLTPDERRLMGERGRLYFDRHFEREMLLDRLEATMREVVEEAQCAC